MDTIQATPIQDAASSPPEALESIDRLDTPVYAAPGLAAPAELAQQILAAEATLAIISGFIDRNLKEGVDYGRTKGKRQDGSTYYTGKYLFKPGAEKITIALGLRPRFKADHVSRDMAGNPPGLIAYICYLVSTSTDKVVATGRGAATVAEQRGSVNSAVKVAEKRAHMDAVLRLAGLSEHFKAEEDQATDERDTEQPAENRRQSRAATSRTATGASRRGDTGAPPRRAATGDNTTQASAVEDIKKQIGALWKSRHPGMNQQDRIAELNLWLQGHIRLGASVDLLTAAEWRAALDILTGKRQATDPLTGRPVTTEQITDDLFA